MTKCNKLILQTICARRIEKSILRNNRKKKKKKKDLTPSNRIRVPRAFRRIKSDKIKLKAIQNTKIKTQLLRSDKLTKNMQYLLFAEKSPFNIKKIKEQSYVSNGYIEVPKYFSFTNSPKESIEALKRIISALYLEDSKGVFLDYEYCTQIDLDAQVLLDIILKDYWRFAHICKHSNRLKKEYFTLSIGGININNEEVQKLLFSVGSPAVLGVKEANFMDIVKYPLCIHYTGNINDPKKRMEQKEIDTSNMADYVLNSLDRLNIKLTSDKIDDLCTVIGEILINAEEHSTTKCRFSIGYFKEEISGDNHLGIFKLVILNFGETIYEKFKSENCPNKDIVIRMQELSTKYTEKKYFGLLGKKFEEETLWTLYSLQEGITSIPYAESKRGNGSIRFIESFFNMKGTDDMDKISRLTIVSGHTRIIFDGKYKIIKKNRNGTTFDMMTFNNSGNIEEKPDNNYVFNDDFYFPGTIISVNILLKEDISLN